jgi:hypothetical protein
MFLTHVCFPSNGILQISILMILFFIYFYQSSIVAVGRGQQTTRITPRQRLRVDRNFNLGVPDLNCRKGRTKASFSCRVTRLNWSERDVLPRVMGRLNSRWRGRGRSRQPGRSGWGSWQSLGGAQQHDDGVVPNYGDHRQAAAQHHPFPFSSWMCRHLPHRDNAGGGRWVSGSLASCTFSLISASPVRPGRVVSALVATTHYSDVAVPFERVRMGQMWMLATCSSTRRTNGMVVLWKSQMEGKRRLEIGGWWFEAPKNCKDPGQMGEVRRHRRQGLEGRRPRAGVRRVIFIFFSPRVIWKYRVCAGCRGVVWKLEE